LESSLISPILDESGTITHYVAVRKIYGKKQLFDELVLAKEKLRRMIALNRIPCKYQP
jgi:hypothetical protein